MKHWTVSEGAHWVQKQAIAEALALQAWQAMSSEERANQVPFMTDTFVYNNDVHEECMRYAHRVLVPLRKAQLDEESRKATAEVDK